MSNPNHMDGMDAVAIIGMAGRFPGARNIDEYWTNLCNGVESISSFTPEELLAEGKDYELVNNPDYIRRRGVIEDATLFDAEFFGFTPREAEVTDPQQRVFLECAWQALESAGYDADRSKHSIGVFAGTSLSEYLFYLYSHPELIRRAGSFQTVHGNDKDFLATRTSYKLNLRGPSVNVNTACSSSLVAVSVACQSLLNGECDMALAGGVTINFPQKTGYLYQEGSIMSPDGHCRAFDARAQGTVSGNGTGVVVLKRLEDALSDGDEIFSVIKGFAINNDGALKVGFAAPSVEGQASVIHAAMGNAGVKPESITYIEAHGTGTALGDPIEMAALTRAFRGAAGRKQFCAIGSVKTNIGHLDVAAGIAGLIKTALALKHGLIPPSLHYQTPNPKIDFKNSPFYVNSTLRAWKPESGPRRAGVSSFGIGGTNVHIVMEQPPEPAQGSVSRSIQCFVLSARTEAALKQSEENLLEYLESNTKEPIPDAAYTLAVGRKTFKHRSAVVFHQREDAIAKLKSGAVHCEWNGKHLPVAMLFTGQGSQYVQMGRQLYSCERVFRESVDHSSEFLKPLLGLDLRDLMHPVSGREAEAEKLLSQTWLTQPALYVLERALLQQWRCWGIEPDSMLGHSLGELVAAVEAGVLDQEDGLRFVALRGRLMWETQPGAMLSAFTTADDALQYQSAGISLAAVNGREQVVFSGDIEAIDKLESLLSEKKIETRRLEVERAFHSQKMECVKDQFLREIRALRFRKPAKRFISNVTGKWATDEVVRTEYWWQQMRSPVQFHAGLKLMLSEKEWAWLEVGPAAVLSKLVRRELREHGLDQAVMSSFRSSQDKDQEQHQMVRSLTELWSHGVEVDWTGYYSNENRRRVALPTYPFQRQHYMAIPAPNHPQEPKKEEHHTAEQAFAPKTTTINKEETMATATVAQPSRVDALTARLCKAWGNLLGIDPAKIDAAATFFELGVDSLLLIQISKLIKDEFKLKIPFRRLLEEFTTIHALAVHLDRNLPAGAFLPQAPAAAATQPAPAPISVANAPAPPSQPLQPVIALATPSVSGTPASIVDAVVAQQLQIMSQQLEMLRAVHAGPAVGSLPETPPSAAVIPASAVTAQSPTIAAPSAPASTATPAKSQPAAFVPFQPIRPHAGDALSEKQQAHLQRLITRYNNRTIKSKQHNSRHRSHFADNRAIQGFRLQWKEMIYPIVSQRSEGAHIFDLDDNKYVDLTMGFGVHLLGHSPSFVVKAIEEQLREGIQLGPQSYLAGQVAEGISQMTGMPRVTFCNSGTEAVMAALRLARVASGRDKVVMFAGSYHGTFDGNLARLEKNATGEFRTVPVGPGTTQNMVNDMIVLPYNDPASIDYIKKCGDQLAAVLVEPVQSRRPDIQPREFLHELRRLTEQSGTALIFDDIVTGFRVHPGGTQAWFDVRADIATYGKVVAGGMPIGIVAGRDEYMGGIDGGVWNYGDGSYPQSDQVVFAGTFCKHPLTMAACNAVIEHLRQTGPQLQQNLNRRATLFVEEINRLMEANDVPMRMANFGSLMRFLLLGNPDYMDLFFYHLLTKGIFVWEGRTAYISTAHTEQDLAIAVRAFEETIMEMRDGGFLPETRSSAVKSASANVPQEKDPRVRIVPASEQQKQMWALAQLGVESSCAYNQSTVLRLSGRLDVPALQRAWNNVVERHEALRTVFSEDGEYQRIFAQCQVDLKVRDLTRDPESKTKEADALKREACEPFNLNQGPLFRGLLIALSESSYVLAISAHHSILDGWSGGTVISDLNAFYLAETHGEKLQLREPMQFDKYVTWQKDQDDLAGLEESQKFWRELFGDSAPLLDLPSDRPRPSLYSYAGGEQRLSLGPDLADQARAFCGQHGCTLFVTLLSSYTMLLSRLAGQQKLVVGIHSAGHALVGSSDLVGHCINLVPLLSCVRPEATFLEHVADNKKKVLDAHGHQLYPYSKLAKDLNLRRDPSRLTLVEAVFNLDQAPEGFRIFGLDAKADTTPTGYSKWDLSFDICDTGSDIQIRCEHNRDLFDPETVRQWLQQYRAILAASLERPEEPIQVIHQQVGLRLGQEKGKNMQKLKAENLEKLRNSRRKMAVTISAV